MYWKIESTGCLVKKKNPDQVAIQIRYSFYFDKTDPGYASRLTDEYVIKASSSYKLNTPITEEDIVKTGRQILQPLHNHFIELPIDCSDSLIENVGNQLLSIVKNYWDLGYFNEGKPVYIPNTLPNYDTYSPDNVLKGEARLKTIKSNTKWQ